MNGGDRLRNPRWVLVAVAAVALVVLFLVLRPGDDEETAPEPSPSPTATAEASPTPTVTAEPTETPEPSPTATATLDAVEIEVEEGRVEGPGRVRVTQGDRVALDVEADVTDEVHVHTYDLFFDVTPNRPARVRFRADIPGVFEVELEQSGVPLTMLEVSP
jgi:FtsP/CotA-like multicopper oxidase with cupredoxin domain